MTDRASNRSDAVRKYDRTTAVVFRKTAEKFGGLSNMAPGFPLEVNGLSIRTSEALYQACRFPKDPEIQRLILDQASPMAAKMVGKPHRDATRHDWDRVRVDIMRWCLRVKLAQNWRTFSSLLMTTGDALIVEESRRDDFWGAKPVGDMLVGKNVLGRLLMELREEVRQLAGPVSSFVDAPSVPEMLLDGRPIEGTLARDRSADVDVPLAVPIQTTIFPVLGDPEA